MKRVMAVVLSGAMLMSNMTAYADEIAFSDTDEPEEEEAEDAEETVCSNFPFFARCRLNQRQRQLTVSVKQ